jgi:hypothetical protein
MVGYVTTFGIRCERQSVTMIVTTKATRMTSWTASSAWIPHPSADERAAVAFRRAPPFPRIRLLRLGQVVPDVAEDVLNLPTQEDHGDDHSDGDDSDDECVLDQALTVVLAEEALNTHGHPPFSRRSLILQQTGGK